jgi:hypothetical protein
MQRKSHPSHKQKMKCVLTWEERALKKYFFNYQTQPTRKQKNGRSDRFISTNLRGDQVSSPHAGRSLNLVQANNM